MTLTAVKTMRLAMWSGPRNISTAMMRSWGNRPDTIVCDEPLYAHYLSETGLPHPGAKDTLRAHESDWRKVVEWLTGPLPEGKTIFYQKHMSHHLLPQIEWDWLADLTHCFLIRDPREMLTSLIEFIPSPTVEDTGLPQQVKLFRWLTEQQKTEPLVIDARDMLQNPEPMLRLVCEQLQIPFYEEMLSWPPGLRETDGAWAPYWYAKVENTTGFARYRPKPDAVPEHLEQVHRECEALYKELYAARCH